MPLSARRAFKPHCVCPGHTAHQLLQGKTDKFVAPAAHACPVSSCTARPGVHSLHVRGRRTLGCSQLCILLHVLVAHCGEQLLVGQPLEMVLPEDTSMLRRLAVSAVTQLSSSSRQPRGVLLQLKDELEQQNKRPSFAPVRDKQPTWMRSFLTAAAAAAVDTLLLQTAVAVVPLQPLVHSVPHVKVCLRVCAGWDK